MATQTFELVSPFMSIYAPSKTWEGASNLLLGQTTNALSTGEMLSLTATYGVTRGNTGGTMPTAKNIGGDAQAVANPAFAYFSETGRGDLVTSGKVPVLQHGPYEADTMIFDRLASGVLSNGADDATALTSSDVGKPVCTVAVRHWKDYALAAVDFATGAHIQSGLGVMSATQSGGGDIFRVGYISRITGTGASMKVRVIFGI